MNEIINVAGLALVGGFGARIGWESAYVLLSLIGDKLHRILGHE